MFPYDTRDRATKIGYILGDAFVVALALVFVWGLFLHR
jgi:hypothetical protein